MVRPCAIFPASFTIRMVFLRARLTKHCLVLSDVDILRRWSGKAYGGK